jgi:predicted aldo/keto reductase-like oxidoreductase
LNWLWSQPELAVVLSGMSDMGQLEENLSIAESWTEGKFLASDEEAVGKVRGFFEDRAKTSCTGCGYCMPCPQGVDIPKNLGFLNQYFLFDGDDAKERCKYFYNVQISGPEKAANCVACRDCEEKCPQHISIPDFLDETALIYSRS